MKGGLSNLLKRQVVKSRKNFLIVSWCSRKRFTWKVTFLYLKERSILFSEAERIERGVWWPSLKKKVGPKWLCLACNLCSVTSLQDVPIFIKTLIKAFRPNYVFGSPFAHEDFGVTLKIILNGFICFSLVNCSLFQGSQYLRVKGEDIFSSLTVSGDHERRAETAHVLWSLQLGSWEN